MLDEQQKYESYMDSGIPWIGTVPADWFWERGKWHHRYRKILNSDGSNENVLSLTLRGVVNNDPSNPEGLVPSDYRTYQLFDKDDLVFKLIDLENVKTSRVGLVHENGIMSSAYIRLTPGSCTNSRFLYFFYYSLYQAEVFNKLGAGVRSTLNQTDLLDLPVPIIDLATQNRIVNFLDAKTAEIDLAITKKRRLIELLKEQKAILINRAVTKGLNPDAPMKDSGVDWIGEMPAHWDALRLETIATYNDDTVNERQYRYRSIKYVDISAVDADSNQYTYEKQAFVNAPSRARRLVQKGDTIISTVRPYLKAVATLLQADPDLVVSTGFAVARPKQGTDASFLGYVLRNDLFIGEVVSNSVGASYPAINASDLFKIKIPVPDLATKNHIVRFLDEKTAEIDTAITKERRLIDLLNEFKQTLIANAVTGKIKI
ncbi:MAG: restriction endonuclease subunit S [Aestuariivita sp.]|nr:restriction endonuclease subunit S [Aestuariivita sp.]